MCRMNVTLPRRLSSQVCTQCFVCSSTWVYGSNSTYKLTLPLLLHHICLPFLTTSQYLAEVRSPNKLHKTYLVRRHSRGRSFKRQGCSEVTPFASLHQLKCVSAEFAMTTGILEAVGKEGAVLWVDTMMLNSRTLIAKWQRSCALVVHVTM